MSRIEIEHLLEKAVADALGVRVEQQDHAPHHAPAIVLKLQRLRHRAS